jgi:hypothetical protein
MDTCPVTGSDILRLWIAPIFNVENTMTTRQSVEQIVRNIMANLVKSARKKPYLDRRRRLLDNLIDACDLLRLRLTSERAASL